MGGAVEVGRCYRMLPDVTGAASALVSQQLSQHGVRVAGPGPGNTVTWVTSTAATPEKRNPGLNQATKIGWKLITIQDSNRFSFITVER